MSRIPRFQQRSLYGLYRRAGVLLRRFALNRFVRNKTARLIELGGHRYKRITLPDSYVAARVAANLARFREFDVFPRLVAVQDRELLLEFVEGRAVDGVLTDALVGRIARFFGTVYGIDRERVKLADSGFRETLRDDLDFLRDVGVIDAALRADLDAAVERLAPTDVWVGMDYLDPLLKNFLQTREGRFVAIDVEEIREGQLLGCGVAKVLLQASAAQRAKLLEGIEAACSVDLAGGMPFVELFFLARWTKLAFLKGRYKIVEGARFERFRAGPPDQDVAR
jgi:hypothetical protein